MSSSIVLFLLVFMLEGKWCLRDVHLKVPAAVRSGQSLTVSCAYTTEREKLYSVKFYLGDTEFYRFIPRDSPPTRVFAINGVPITLQESSLNSSKVTLHHIHRDMTGHYKCEVSADAPLFHTVIKSTFVTVTEDPLVPPSITIDKQSYGQRETIHANCTSKGGYPLANLTWLLNGQQVTRRMRQYVVEGEVDSSILELQLQVSPAVTEEGSLRLRCVASQFSLYHAVADLVLREETSETDFESAEKPYKNIGVCRRASVELLLMFTILAATSSQGLLSLTKGESTP